MAFDLPSRRINVYSIKSFKLTQTINIKALNKKEIRQLAKYSMHRLFPLDNHTFIVKFIPTNYPRHPGYNTNKLEQKFFIMNEKGKIISHMILKQKGLQFGFYLTKVDGRFRLGIFPFLPHSISTVSKNGILYSANDENFLIKIYNAKGRYLRAVYCPFKKVPLKEGRVLKMQKNKPHAKIYQNIIRKNKLPKTWPALHVLKVDDQHRMWVATIIKNQKVYQWWVLNPKGKLLARFRWPRAKPIQEIKNGYLYAKQANKKGIQRIVRYKIQMQ
jgi:hypothetical protein